MADIFVSYKRTDAARVAQIVALLEGEGWSVWWDTRLAGGEHWDAVIERELEAARGVVVVWSPASIDRDKAYWVHLEAHHGRERGILVPVTIEGVMPPFAFKLIQARDLTHWNGAARQGAESFLADVKKTLDKAPGDSAVTPQTPPVQHASPGAPAIALAAEEWGRLKDTADLTKLRRFVQHFASTYYAELAEERIAELEEAARAKAAAEAAARAKAQAEAEARAKEEARRAELKGKIGGIGDRDTLLSLLQEAPEAVAARLQALGFLRVPSQKEGKPHTLWLKPGESFRDLDTAPEMVIVPAGEFWMGSKDGEGSDSERPRHKVTIPRPFAVGRYAVTFDEWDAARAAGGVSHNPSDQGWGRGRRPVINVNWDDAQAYIKWLSSKTAQPYRLLSEAEWEYCCRAGTETPYSFGGKESDLDRYAWYSANSGSKTHPVGEKLPNEWGLHDMHGNVWEWCEDCWNGNYHNAPGDGSAWTTPGGTYRVLRGGSWGNYPQVLRAAYRVSIYPDSRNYVYGFRVALGWQDLNR
ncbi:MAG: SUMF1/EgtB/PvdO family nonheme iron enzyme [Rhodomicrobium sp.]